MKQVDYVPRKDVDFNEWLKGLKKGATESAALLGVTDEELALLTECAAGFEEDLKKADDLTSKAKAAVSAKDATRRKAEKVARGLAQRMKAHRNYKASLGVGMGIEGGGAAGRDEGSQTDGQCGGAGPRLGGTELCEGRV